MIHMSEGLGVNCTFCHNTRAFSQWPQSPPQRAVAWHGIQMARDLNTAWLDPLLSVFPPARLGPTGDGPKLNCATCHQGAYKPLYGADILQGHPGLVAPKGTEVVAPAEAPAVPAATVSEAAPVKAPG